MTEDLHIINSRWITKTEFEEPPVIVIQEDQPRIGPKRGHWDPEVMYRATVFSPSEQRVVSEIQHYLPHFCILPDGRFGDQPGYCDEPGSSRGVTFDQGEGSHPAIHSGWHSHTATENGANVGLRGKFILDDPTSNLPIHQFPSVWENTVAWQRNGYREGRGIEIYAADERIHFGMQFATLVASAPMGSSVVQPSIWKDYVAYVRQEGFNRSLEYVQIGESNPTVVPGAPLGASWPHFRDEVIAFASQGQIYVHHMGDTTSAPVAPLPNAFCQYFDKPRVSEYGRYVLYLGIGCFGDGGNALYLTDRFTGKVNLVSNSVVASPADLPAEYDIDDRVIVYTHMDGTRNRIRMVAF